MFYEIFDSQRDINEKQNLEIKSINRELEKLQLQHDTLKSKLASNTLINKSDTLSVSSKVSNRDYVFILNVIYLIILSLVVLIVLYQFNHLILLILY